MLDALASYGPEGPSAEQKRALLTALERIEQAEATTEDVRSIDRALRAAGLETVPARRAGR